MRSVSIRSHRKVWTSPHVGTVLLALSCAACAASPPPCAVPGAARGIAGADARTDQAAHVGLHIIHALEQSNATQAVATFDARLSRELTPRGLDLLWRGLKQQHGALTAVQLFEESAAGPNLLLSYAVLFERAVYRLQLRTDRSSGKVAALSFRNIDSAVTPLPTAAAPGDQNADFRVHAATVGASPLTLPAIVTTPEAPGRYPAAVLIGDSGLADRDEQFQGIRPFKKLAEALARRGIVTVRYDKRTRWYPELKTQRPDFTVEQELIEDALSAVDALRARPDVDPARIYLIGHSLGALVAPEIGARCHCNGVVMLGPPGRPVLDVLATQLKADAPADDHTKLATEIARIRSGELANDAPVLGATAHYYRDLERRDELAVARQLPVPLLVLRGQHDPHVLEQDEAIWRTALEHKRCAAVEPVAGIGHHLVPEGGSPSISHGWLFDRIARFVQEAPNCKVL